MHDSKIN